MCLAKVHVIDRTNRHSPTDETGFAIDVDRPRHGNEP